MRLYKTDSRIRGLHLVGLLGGVLVFALSLSAGEQVELQRCGGPERFDLADPAASLSALVATSSTPSPLSRAAALVPEVRAAALLLELGPVLALPEEWLGPAVP